MIRMGKSIRHIKVNVLFAVTMLVEYTLPPTPYWSSYIFTLVQKVKLGHQKIHASINTPSLC